jgi:hypothetical protein
MPPGRERITFHITQGDAAMFGHKPSAVSPAPVRHALGLPAGSVRGLLAVGVLGVSWLLVWRADYYEETLPVAFVYLQVLGVLTLAHFFAAHGGSIGPKTGSRSPLGLPGGTLRLLLVVGYLGLAVFLSIHQKITFAMPTQTQWVLIILVVLTCFFLGHFITGLVRFFSAGVLPYWFQDLQAWVALIALLLLGIQTLLYTVIKPSLPPDYQDSFNWPMFDAILAGLVGLYFGARS